jgi:hypothetical protein
MFDEDDGSTELFRIITLLNNAMVNIRNVKTVEDLQNVINNLNRVILLIKTTIASQGKSIK